MNQLYLSMFDSPWNSNLFGLRYGQIRPMKGVAGNAHWYNKAGERLGFGDIGRRNRELKMKRLPMWECITGCALKVYDNGGKTIDRFTVVFKPKYKSFRYECLSMNNRPFDPQGFCQHSDCRIGSHLGKRILFDSLPEDCKKAVIMDGTL